MDNDPIVLAHAHYLLKSVEPGGTRYIQADLRDTGSIIDQAADFLDLSQPVAVMLVGLLHHFDEDDPYCLVARLTEAVPSGSYLAMSHLAIDIMPEAMEAALSTSTRRWRSRGSRLTCGRGQVLRGPRAGGAGRGAGRRVAQPLAAPAAGVDQPAVRGRRPQALSRPARPAPRRVDEVSASDRPPRGSNRAAARSCAGAAAARPVARCSVTSASSAPRTSRAATAGGTVSSGKPSASHAANGVEGVDEGPGGLPGRGVAVQALAEQQRGSPPPRACGPPASRTGPRTGPEGQPRIGGRVLGGHALAVAPLLDEGPQQVGLGREVVVDRGDVEAAGRRQPAHRRPAPPSSLTRPSAASRIRPRWPAVPASVGWGRLTPSPPAPGGARA